MTAHPTYSGCGLQPDRHGLLPHEVRNAGLRNFREKVANVRPEVVSRTGLDRFVYDLDPIGNSSLWDSTDTSTGSKRTRYITKMWHDPVIFGLQDIQDRSLDDSIVDRSHDNRTFLAGSLSFHNTMLSGKNEPSTVKILLNAPQMRNRIFGDPLNFSLESVMT